MSKTLGGMAGAPPTLAYAAGLSASAGLPAAGVEDSLDAAEAEPPAAGEPAAEDRAEPRGSGDAAGVNAPPAAPAAEEASDAAVDAASEAADAGAAASPD